MWVWLILINEKKFELNLDWFEYLIKKIKVKSLLSKSLSEYAYFFDFWLFECFFDFSIIRLEPKEFEGEDVRN